MKIAKMGQDYLEISENNLQESKPSHKVHLIKLNFTEPTKEKILTVINKYNDTNRYVINNNIKYYNSILKTLNKKYYIENDGSQKLITFFKKNNKVLLNFLLLSDDELLYVMNNIDDVLYNAEVILLNKDMLSSLEETLNNWNGNIILN